MRSERGWLILAAMVGAAVVASVLIRPAAPPAVLLVLGPLLASHRLTVRATAGLAGTAVALAALPSGTGDAPYAPFAAYGPVVSVLSVAAGGASAVLSARARTGDRAALERLTRLAELAQRAVVRPLPREIGGLDLALRTRSATDGALLGGDLYDATLTAAGPRLLIGDVRGHGVDAARVGAAVLCAFRQTAAAEPDPVALAHLLDDRIAPDLGDEDFVTLLLADFGPEEVRLVNCGHPPPLRTGGRMKLLEAPNPSPPLGLAPRPSLQRVALGLDQRLLFYTDGLSEARNARGDMFPFDRRVQAALAAPTVEEAVADLLDLFHQHTAGGERARGGDDLTLLLVQPTVGVLGGEPGRALDGEDRRPPLRST
ncbi:PP2C family protein-serine/threonine phosphatase [Streptomyces varsoviensis]|uniref:PP2C family protein-serine/threonine phosphatase n=1 Tax=Streptomyces varsoviensis TaxID=67373 RepID=UPI000A49B835|nr:PP2C family protein-serine/threonine phosphatase [Streptomyces varsoviensis]